MSSVRPQFFTPDRNITLVSTIPWFIRNNTTPVIPEIELDDDNTYVLDGWSLGGAPEVSYHFDIIDNVNRQYNVSETITPVLNNAAGDVTYSVDPTSDIQLNTSTGVLTLPSFSQQAQTTNRLYTLTATDANGQKTSTSFRVRLFAPSDNSLAAEVAARSFVHGREISPIHLSAFIPGSSAVTWAITGTGNIALPAGLSLDTNTGIITGTPTQPETSRIVPWRATRGSQTVDGSVVIEVKPTVPRVPLWKIDVSVYSNGTYVASPPVRVLGEGSIQTKIYEKLTGSLSSATNGESLISPYAFSQFDEIRLMVGFADGHVSVEHPAELLVPNYKISISLSEEMTGDFKEIIINSSNSFRCSRAREAAPPYRIYGIKY